MMWLARLRLTADSSCLALARVQMTRSAEQSISGYWRMTGLDASIPQENGSNVGHVCSTSIMCCEDRPDYCLRMYLQPKQYGEKHCSPAKNANTRLRPALISDKLTRRWAPLFVTYGGPLNGPAVGRFQQQQSGAGWCRWGRVHLIKQAEKN